jgi:hypothetical protein
LVEVEWHAVAMTRSQDVNTRAVTRRVGSGSGLVDAGLKRKNEGSEVILDNVLKLESSSHHQVERWDLVK